MEPETFLTYELSVSVQTHDIKQVEAGRSARSVETLAVQVSSATRELDGLQEKVRFVINWSFFYSRRLLFSFLLRWMIGCGGTSTPERSSSLRRKRRLKVSWPGRLSVY